ncbi:hypothetical protein [Micromonospora marina]|uniref:hypothetical protein n=1 Tax=Micromonospora marina TaxID=307120 RepID=UPI0034549067
MFTLAEAAEPQRGWGGPIALLVGVAAFLAFAGLHYWWQERKGLPSPTDDDDTDLGVNEQVSAVSDTDDTDRDTNPWGRIVNRGGRRVRVYDTGRDGELDLDLTELNPETPEEAADRMDREGVPYMEIVRTVMADYRVSESSAKRAIRDSRRARSAS